MPIGKTGDAGACVSGSALGGMTDTNTETLMTFRISDPRLAGLVYLLLVLTGIFNLIYVPSLTVAGRDPLETLEAIRSQHVLFAAGACVGLLSYVLYLCLPVILHRVLQPHGSTLARLMVLLTAVSIPISFIAIAEKFAILDSLQVSATLDAELLASSVMEHLERYRSLIGLSSIFWGLWLIPRAILSGRARLVPWPLAVLLGLGGLAFLIEFVVPLFWSGFSGSLVQTIVGTPSSLGELGTCLWLLLAPHSRFRTKQSAAA